MEVWYSVNLKHAIMGWVPPEVSKGCFQLHDCLQMLYLSYALIVLFIIIITLSIEVRTCGRDRILIVMVIGDRTGKHSVGTLTKLRPIHSM